MKPTGHNLTSPSKAEDRSRQHIGKIGNRTEPGIAQYVASVDGLLAVACCMCPRNCQWSQMWRKLDFSASLAVLYRG